jgi:hypothetical protein
MPFAVYVVPVNDFLDFFINPSPRRAIVKVFVTTSFYKLNVFGIGYKFGRRSEASLKICYEHNSLSKTEAIILVPNGINTF